MPHTPFEACRLLTWLVHVCATQDKFREVTEAYEILSDKEKRVIYDFNGIGAVKKMGQGDQGGGGSPFDMFFGGGGGQQRNQRGRNMDIELPVSLEDLYIGNEKAATVKRRVVCRNCKGKAHLPRCQASLTMKPHHGPDPSPVPPLTAASTFPGVWAVSEGEEDGA